MAALVDTNVLAYVHDPHAPVKQRVAAELLRCGLVSGTIRIAHQAIVEFVSAVSRLSRGRPPLLPLHVARREAEELLATYPVLLPTHALVRTAIRGSASYQLSWYDAHMWAYAEHYGLDTLISEDFAHDRMYGTVRTINPFVPRMPEGVREPLLPYRATQARRGSARRT